MTWRTHIIKRRPEKTRKITTDDLTPDEIIQGGRTENYRVVEFEFLEVNNPKMNLNSIYKITLKGSSEYNKASFYSKVKELILGTPELDSWDNTEDVVS